MRYRPIQAAPRERVPFTLWGPKRIRTVLATVAASAIGLVPVVLVGSPAYAASSVSDLTISNAGAWEGGKVSFTLTYTGANEGTFTLDTESGASATATENATKGTDFTGTPSPASVTFPGTLSGKTNTVTVTVTTTVDDDATDPATTGEADESFTLVATDTAAGTKSGTGTIWQASTTNAVTLSGGQTVAETATTSNGVATQKTVQVTATQTYPQPHDVVIPVLTTSPDPTRRLQADGLWATSGGGPNRDYTALGADATITIPAYETSASTTVTLWDDTADEVTTQYFNVNVDTTRAPSYDTDVWSVQGAKVATEDAAVEFGVTDDDATPTVSIGNAGAVTEGGKLGFPVTLSNPSERAVTVDFATSNGAADTSSNGAVEPDDYTAVSLTAAGSNALTFPQYGKSVTAMVQTKPDLVVEGAENVKGTISNPVNATAGTPLTATGLINDGNDAPAVALDTRPNAPTNPEVYPLDPMADVSATFDEGDTGETDTFIKVSLGADSAQIPVKVDYKFVDATAKNGVDYVGTSGSITIPAGAYSATDAKIPVKIIGDRLYENPNETFTVVLSSPNNSIATASVGEHTFTILDNDSQPTWSTRDISIAEGNTGQTMAKVPLTLSAPVANDVTFAISGWGTGSADDTGVNSGATVGADDYERPTGATGKITAGSTTGYIEIPINGDTVYERDESFSVDLLATGASNAVSADVSHTARVTITNDDAAPTVTFNQMAGTEGSTVRITGTTTGLSQYDYKLGLAIAPTGTSPATAGTDYEVSANPVTSYTVTRGNQGAFTSNPLAEVYLMPDDVDEPIETFGITATETSPSPVGVVTTTGVYRINDDPADLPPAASVRDESIGEWEGSVDVRVDFAFDQNTKATEQTVTVPWWTVDGTAKAGEDYRAAKGVLTLKPGSLLGTINVEILNDKLKEAEENFWVKLGTPGPTGAMVTKGTGEVTIKSDDTANPTTPTIAVSGPARGAGNAVITGRVDPNSDVELWGAPIAGNGELKWLVSAKADGNGNYRFSRAISTGYRFAVQSQEMNSVERAVKITQNPAFSVSSTRGKLTVAVTGNPKAAGQAVVVQRWSGGKWVTAYKGTTTSTGFKKTYTAKSRSKHTLRAFVAGNTAAGLNGGYSVQRTITIK